jgi:hypothetical protein
VGLVLGGRGGEAMKDPIRVLPTANATALEVLDIGHSPDWVRQPNSADNLPFLAQLPITAL